jgi:hypothetical protein
MAVSTNIMPGDNAVQKQTAIQLQAQLHHNVANDAINLP